MDFKINFNAKAWGIFGAVVGLVNLLLLWGLARLFEIDFAAMVKSTTVGKLAIGFGQGTELLIVFSVVFWAIVVLLGKYLTSLVAKNFRDDILNLFVPVFVGVAIVTALLMQSLEPMMYLVRGLQVLILVIGADLVYAIFKVKAPG